MFESGGYEREYTERAGVRLEFRSLKDSLTDVRRYDVFERCNRVLKGEK
jgi:hypothetical protein